MKTKVCIILAVFSVFTPDLTAEDLSLLIDRNLCLQFSGREGNGYQFESSTNLLNWNAYGTFFVATGVSQTQSISAVDNPLEFFRVKALVTATNGSTPTSCPEQDNVNVPLRGDVHGFTIVATHPAFVVTNCDCPPNFEGCTNSDPGYSFPYLSTNLYDDNVDTFVRLRRETDFWRPNGMQVTANGTNHYTNIHYLAIGRKLVEGQWPEYCVLYADGYLRLIPHPPPPPGPCNVCYGSSVLVGPAPVADRPFADIATVDYNSSSRELLVTYGHGGSAVIDVGWVTRSNAIVYVTVANPANQPFCTFRSMWVADGICDVDHVDWTDLSGTTTTEPILEFVGTAGTEWLFKRTTNSVHNPSAPDIRILPD